MKHVPFQSKYKPNFYVVEEIQGGVQRFPHTEQLPTLLRAINLEFRWALPSFLDNIDDRAPGYYRYARHLGVLQFCGAIHAARPDELRLFPLLGRDMVSRVALIQQTTEHTALGPCHRFSFHDGTGFNSEIFLSGKRLVFTAHVIDRFSERGAGFAREDLTYMLIAFFGAPCISMLVNGGRAFVVPHAGSLVALTYQETDTEFILTTCLAMDEIRTLTPELPPQVFNFHYDQPFVRPKLRNWIPTLVVGDWLQRWRNKTPIVLRDSADKETWSSFASRIFDVARAHGATPEMNFVFLDDIPGPCIATVPSGRAAPQFDELEMFQKAFPGKDWATAFSERDLRKPGPRKKAERQRRGLVKIDFPDTTTPRIKQ